MDTEPRAKCTSRGATVNPHTSAPCPDCGSPGTKEVEKTVQAGVVAAATVDRARIRTWFTFNWRAIALLMGVSLIQPFVSLPVSLPLRGLLATLTSVGLGMAGLVVGCFAIAKTREIERHI